MQDESGRMRPIEKSEFTKMLESKDQKNVVQIGDVFMIRDCRFEVVDIWPTGIAAKGLSREEYQQKCKSRS